MTPAALAAADPVIALHAAAACLALVLGPLLALRRRRDRWHRWGGRVWAAAMAAVALTALFINEIRLVGPFSPLHLFVPVTLVALWQGVAAIRRGNPAAHGWTMAALYVTALAVPGAFTLLPGRRMNAILFGGDSWAGFALGAAVLAAAAWAVWRAAIPPFHPPHPRLDRGVVRSWRNW